MDPQDCITPITLVSYCDDDRQWVAGELTCRLEEEEKTVVKVKDRDYDVGISQIESFCEWLPECTNIVLVLSRGYLESGLCRRELELSLASSKRLIAVLLEDCALPAGVQGRVCLEYRQDKLFWPRLLAATSQKNDKVSGHRTPTQPAQRILLPKLPSRCFGRDAAIAEVTTLIAASTRELSVESLIRQTGDNVVGIWGMGGAGKTVLALMVAQKLEKSRQVFWVTMGEQRPRVLENLALLASGMANTPRSFSNISDAVSDIFQQTQYKDDLIVLDDVWNLNEAQVITEAVSGTCQVLVITRNKDVLVSLKVRHLFELKPLTKSDAEKFVFNAAGFSDASDHRDQELSRSVQRILKACQCNPLALSVVASSVTKPENVQQWIDTADELDKVGIDALGGDKERIVEASIDVSYRALSSNIDQKRFVMCGIFPEDTDIPEETLVLLWCYPDSTCQQLEAAGDADLSLLQLRAKRTACRLYHRSLLTTGTNENSYRIHRIVRDYARNRLRKQASTHRKLLKAYKSEYLSKQREYPNDGYFFHYVMYHMSCACLHDEMASLLTDFRWLKRKLEKTDIASLLSDFSQVVQPSHFVDQVCKALHLSGHVLSTDKSQLGGQLLGRLSDSPEEAVRGLVEQVRRNDSERDISVLHPCQSCLVAPGGPIVKTYDRHTDAVLCIAVTSDRTKRVFTGSADFTIRAWELESLRDLGILRGHCSHVYAMALSRDDRRLASASYDTTVKIWDADKLENLWTLTSHSDKVNAVAFVDDGKRVVSGSSDKTVRVWDLTSTSTSKVLTGHTGQVRALCAFHRSNNVASGSSDNTIRIWNMRNFSSSKLTGHDGIVFSLAITNDDKYLVSASGDRSVGVWGTNRRELIHKLHGHTNSVYSVTLSPDDTRIVSGGGMDDDTIRIWSLGEGKQVCVYRGHSDSIRCVRVVKSAQGALLLSGSLDTTCRLWRMEGSLQEVHRLPGHDLATYAVAISVNGSRAVSGSRNGELRAWNARTGELVAIRTSAHSRSIRAVAVAQDGNTFVSGSKDRQVKVWSLLPQPDKPGTFRLIRKHVLTCHGGTVQAVAISKDSKLAASGGWDGIVVVWNIQTAEVVQTFRHVSYGVMSVAFSGDDTILACSRDNISCEWSLVGTTVTRPTSTVHGPEARWLSYPALVLPHQKKIVSGCPEEGRYRVWDETGRESRGYCGHPDGAVITALAVDHKYDLLLSASTGGTITTVSLCGDSQAIHYVSNVEESASYVSAILFTRHEDGVSFLTGDTEGAVRFWHCNRSRAPVGEMAVINIGKTPGRITCFCDVGDSSVLSGSAGGFLAVWDIRKASRQTECWGAHTGDVTSVVATTLEHEPVVLSSSLDHTVKIWSVNATTRYGRPLRTILVPDSCPAPTHLSVTSGGSYVVTGSADNKLRAYDVNNGALLREYTSEFYGVNCVGFTGDDGELMCSYNGSYLEAWNFNTAESSTLKQDFCSRGFGTWCHFSAIAGDSATVVTGNSLNKLIIWDRMSGSVLSEQEPLGPYQAEVTRSQQDVTCVTVTSDGRLVVSGSADKSVRVWCVKREKFFQLCRFTFEHQPLAVAVAKDGKICVGLRNGQVCFLQLKNPSSPLK
ncbi:uncharacterized WD repeat-containing protein alr2800-like [Branchiostoma floridae]|uniref:Uncharacterized WD repeat-containing protein alr2800-like n=2 Tax=Branchiostoma floridae TaxID=7739 RepID=A0A9J7KXT3_BRAFL|nr:uncharacterized WD repeat-containing protein alr2800-like [Branchiostoma floridae]